MQYSYGCDACQVSPNNQTMISVENAKAQLSQFQTLNPESRTVSVILLLARLMGQYCFAGWRLSSSVGVCRRL